MNESLVENMVRIGIVSDVDKKKRMVRVLFPNLNMTSGWLYVLQSPPDVKIIIDFTVTPWMPSVNDRVLCLYIPVLNGDGFVLGAI